MNPENILITTITPDDWQVLRDIKIESLTHEPIAFEDSKEGLEKYTQRTEDEWRDRLNPNQKNKVWYFAKDIINNKYIGSTFVEVKDEVATIQHVYVDKEYRGQGIGKKILQNIIGILKEINNVKSIEIQVLETQKPAINLYHELGFVDEKVIENGAKRGVNCYNEIEMRLSL